MGDIVSLVKHRKELIKEQKEHRRELVQEKIDGLFDKDALYFSPSKNKDGATFGIFYKHAVTIENDYAKDLVILVYNYLEFESTPVCKGRLWLPKMYNNTDYLKFYNNSLLNGTWKLFINEEIEEAMHQDKNPNYGLVEKIWDELIDNYLDD